MKHTLIAALLFLFLAACDSADQRLREIESGLCVEKKRFFSDEELVQIVLRNIATEAWERRYADPQAFVRAHPSCCVVRRYPRKEDWFPGTSEIDPENRVGARLDEIAQGNYIVQIRLTYALDQYTRNEINLVSACGLSLYRQWRTT